MRDKVQRAGYVGGMTEAAPEPSNADLLEFMRTAFAHLSTEISGVKADVSEVKADTADVKAGMLVMAEELGHEIAQSEARLTSRISDVQQVVQSLKADLAAHIADGHDGHAGPRAA